MKSREITRIGAIASECSNDKIHVVVDRSWNKKRVFCLLKPLDEMWKEQERNNVKRGKLVSSVIDLVSQGNQQLAK